MAVLTEAQRGGATLDKREDDHMSSPEKPHREATSGSPTVFLSAALETDIEPVMLLLARNGFRSVQWTQLPVGGIGRRLRDGISACAALVAVVDRAVVAPAVVLEIGAALGQGLPVIIVAMNASAAADLEPALRELPMVSVIGNASAVGARLAETLRAAMEAEEQTSRSARRRERSERTAMPSQDTDFETKVAAILRERGARVVAEPAGPELDKRADLAIWIDGLSHPSFNPILVETKVQPDASIAEKQLRQLLAAYQCVLGLVVVPGDMPVKWQVNSTSAVATIGSSNLEHEDLVRLLSDGRNRWAHGDR